jgi:hypothetical protein
VNHESSSKNGSALRTVVDDSGFGASATNHRLAARGTRQVNAPKASNLDTRPLRLGLGEEGCEDVSSGLATRSVGQELIPSEMNSRWTAGDVVAPCGGRVCHYKKNRNDGQQSDRAKQESGHETTGSAAIGRNEQVFC